MNVETQLMHSSGDEVAIVINVADANSCFILISEKIFVLFAARHAKKLNLFVLWQKIWIEAIKYSSHMMANIQKQ